MTDKLLTIIVPSYNMEQYLGKCLSSLITTNGRECVEVIIVNDGSKDKTLSIARDFRSRYPQLFTIVDKPNGNYGSCINASLKIANGKYIKVLDADDFFEKSEFEKYLIFLKTANYDLILTDYQEVDTDGNVLKCHRFNFDWAETSNTSDIKAADLQMHTITWKTENLISMGYCQTEGISYTDSEWGYYPLIRAKSIAYFNCMLYKYTVGRIGQTMDKSVYYKNMWHNIVGVKSMLKWYSRQDWPNADVHEILHHKLITRLSSIYASYLIYGYRVLDISELKDLDSQIKEKYPEIYIDMEQCMAPIKVIRCKFIRDWHSPHLIGKLKIEFIRYMKTIRSFLEAVLK